MASLKDPVFVLSGLSIVAFGLVAGTFFAFSTFVMSALGRRPPAEGMAAMQTINVTVFNPFFMGTFLGMAAGSVGWMAHAVWRWSTPAATWELAGGLLYLVGTFGVTMVGNVPLNNQLERLDPNDSASAALWREYQVAWTRWNHVRTLAAMGATGCLVVAIKVGTNG